LLSAYRQIRKKHSVPARWPPSFAVAGLSYERFERPQGAPAKPIWDQAARCAWLSRQTQFDSGPYEQAARVFRQHGYASEAEQILMAERRHARRVDQADAAWPRRARGAPPGSPSCSAAGPTSCRPPRSGPC